MLTIEHGNLVRLKSAINRYWYNGKKTHAENAFGPFLYLLLLVNCNPESSTA